MSIDDDQLYLFREFLPAEQCERFCRKIPDIGQRAEPLYWEARTRDITRDEVVRRAASHLSRRFNMEFSAEQAQTQNWHVGTHSGLHVHDHANRRHIIYNSLIYLNDGFEGGEFFTDRETIKPEVGLMTLFNGQNIRHGVRRVCGRDRKTIIIWWNTRPSNSTHEDPTLG